MFETKNMDIKTLNIEKDISSRLGNILLAKGVVNPQVLIKAIRKRIDENSNSGLNRNLAQILVQDFSCDHDAIYKEVANLYAFRSYEIDLEEKENPRINELKTLIDSYTSEDRKQMLIYKVIPVRFDKRKEKITFAAVDPTLQEIPKLAYSLKAKAYETYYLPLSKYEQLIKVLIITENEFLKNIKEDNYVVPEFKEETNIDESLLQVEINKSALINLFEGALVEGVRRGASDIHVIPLNSKETDISFRVDGKLNLWHKQINTLPEAVIAVVKDRSRGLDRFEREQGQDGYIQREIDGHTIRFRVSILPIAGAEVKNKFESVVIRILDDRKIIKNLDDLGLTGYAKSSFLKAITKPQGMIILTGPTGSGKSTTIIAALHQVLNPTVNVLTVEDPIEYVIKGARQIKLSHKMNFDQAIRSILRHDPDIVLVGEVRDKESADIAIKLANTGHLTFTTLHTNDATSVVSRLYKMGIEPFLLAYSINVIVAQRLVRKLCSKCKKKVDNVTPEFLRKLNLNPEEWNNSIVYEAKGCTRCNNTGFSGRLAIHETLYFTKEIRQLIFSAGEKIDEESIRNEAKKDGMLTLRESGFEKVKMGLTSFEEVIFSTTDN